MRLYLLFWALLLCRLTATAQPFYNFKFKTYTANEGLVHNFTKRCLQDNKGFLWIITQHGLSRFDGYYFRNFEHTLTDSAGLPANDLADIAIDSKDRIWLSYKKGICFYDQATHRFTIIRQKDKPLKSYSLLYDKKRNCIWSADYNGYTKIDCNSLEATSTAFKEKDPDYGELNPLFLDSRDRLWVLYSRNNYHCISLPDGMQYHHPEAISPTAVYEDDEHNIWMTTWQEGFKKVNIEPGKPHTFVDYSDPFLQIAQDGRDYISNAVTSSSTLGGKNMLWVVKNTDGILLFDKKQDRFVQQISYDPNSKNGIATDFIEWIYTDRDDNLWLCTWHGIARVNKNEQQFSSRELPELRSQLYNAVSGIINDPNDKNIYWLAATGSGLFKYSRATGKPVDQYYHYYNEHKKTFSGPDENYDWRWMTELWMDDTRQIWGSTYAGLVRIRNGQVSRLKLIDDNKQLCYIRFSKQLRKNTLLAAGDNGIFIIDATTAVYHFYRDQQSPGNIFYDADSLDNSRIVLASKEGIKTFDQEKKVFAPLVSPQYDSFSKQTVCIERIGNTLYTGNNNGLWSYDIPTGKISRLGIEQNIDKIDENTLKKDDNKNLWIYTSHGLYKYDTRKAQFEKFTTSDGIYDLSDDHLNFFSYNNLFYLGYRMALTSFDPAGVNINSKKISPYITDIYINNQLLDISPEAYASIPLSLAHDENEIRISYTAPDYTNADKITFQYRLKGYDSTWINAGSRRNTVFNNLEPGHYSFEVKAANSSGLWNHDPAVFYFTIATPFWRTWWFMLLVTALVGMATYFIYRYRLRQIKKIYEVRSSISRSLHDEVGATLSSINIYSDVARHTTNDPNVQQLIGKVYDASANAMENMSDIVWYVNPKNDLLENLFVRMREYALPLLEAKNIQVSFEADEGLNELKTTMQQRHHLYLIFKEAINNAAKYAAASSIAISLSRQGNWLNMEITDNGKGFDTAAAFSGNGLNNMQSRAAEINASIDIDSKPGTGTGIRLQMPIA
ncbi:MAG: triple tyrosine motif-containing protein [Ferruginibacter sp.]